MDIAALGFAVDSAPLTKGAAELDRLTASAKKAEDAAVGMGSRVTDAAKKAEAANGGASASTQNLANSYGVLEVMARRAAAAVSLIAGALSVQAIAGLADVYSDLNARVGLAIRNMEASREVMDRLNVVARRTYSSLELTAESFVRNANTLRELGKSTNEQLDFTEALNLALVVSGAKAERARMLQDSLAKAMAGGALRGQELNTVIESGGRVAEVLAEELGVSTNQLRRMGEQGLITSEVIFNALTKRLQQLQEEAKKMPATIGDAFLIVRNAALQLIGVYDQQNKLSESLATTIISLADNLDILAKSAVSLGIALAVALSGTIIGAVRTLAVAIATGLVTAFNALTAAMLRNPFTDDAGNRPRRWKCRGIHLRCHPRFPRSVRDRELRDLEASGGCEPNARARTSVIKVLLEPSAVAASVVAQLRGDGLTDYPFIPADLDAEIGRWCEMNSVEPLPGCLVREAITSVPGVRRTRMWLNSHNPSHRYIRRRQRAHGETNDRPTIYIIDNP